MLIFNLANIIARCIKADQLISILHTLKISGEMQGDERSNTSLKSTYGSIQNNELHQAMQTGTVPSELTGENKESKTIYINIIFNTNFT